MPHLVLMVGLPGAGKTTRARQLEVSLPALRLTPDEWILRLLGADAGRPAQDAIRDSVEAVLTDLAMRALTLGVNVILDFGFWSREERDRFRALGETVGASSEIVFVDAPLTELKRRVSTRSPHNTLSISATEMDEFARAFEPPEPDELQVRV